MKKVLQIVMLLVVFGLSKSIAQTYYINENFSSSNVPAGWSSTAAGTGGQWVFGPGLTNSYLPIGNRPSCALINDAGCACVEDSARLTTMAVNLTSATTVFLSFDYVYAQYYSGSTGATEIFWTEKSLDGGTTWTFMDSIPGLYNNGPYWATAGWDLSSQLAGQANVKIRFHYSDNGTAIVGAGITNVKLYSPIANDAALTAITPVAGTSTAYGVVGNTVTIGGTIYNNGSNAITSMVINLTDGINTWPYTYSGNIAPLTSANFTHSHLYNIAATGLHPLTMYASLTGDTDNINDTLHTLIVGAIFSPVHKVTFEEETGCWCGFCVRGLVYMDSMSNSANAANCELIAVHDADPMVINAYDAGATTMPGFSGFPSIEIDRKVIDDPSNIFPEYTAHIGDFGIADITVTPTYNWTTGLLNVSASAHFAVDVAPGNGAYNLAYVVTEDRVHSILSTYDQHNYYNGGSYGPLSNLEYDFVTLPNPVPAAQMYYDHVARAIAGSYTGTNGSLPGTIAGGTTQNYTFPTTYTVPATSNPLKMKVIVLLINTVTGQIMNAADAPLSPTGIADASASVSTFTVYPNPFNETANIEFSLIKDENVVLNVYNMLGEKVYSVNNGTMSQGEHMIQLNGANLSSGLYMVSLTAGDNTITRKVSLNK